MLLNISIHKTIQDFWQMVWEAEAQLIGKFMVKIVKKSHFSDACQPAPDQQGRHNPLVHPKPGKTRTGFWRVLAEPADCEPPDANANVPVDHNVHTGEAGPTAHPLPPVLRGFLGTGRSLLHGNFHWADRCGGQCEAVHRE